jgi:hypothetical protein
VASGATNAADRLAQVVVAAWPGVQKISELQGTLLRRASEAKKYPSALCGLFGVEKALKLILRVIFDARPANQLLKPRGEQLVLFTLAMLVHGMALHPYMRTVDYYYSVLYQLHLPLRLAWYLCIVVEGVTWLPRVPMRFREAVAIAQCATFAVVLYAEPGEDRLGVDLAALCALKAMPSFLSLYDDSHQEVGRMDATMSPAVRLSRTTFCND